MVGLAPPALDRPFRVMDEHALWVRRESCSQKRNEDRATGSSISHIDDLLEELIGHILSFLPMKEAVQTSILSKRWRYRWVYIPRLVFLESAMTNREHFANFLGRAIAIRGSCPIEGFHLMCCVLDEDEASRIAQWIAAVARRKVEDCCIRLCFLEDRFFSTRCLFSCETLVRLKLCIRSALQLPPDVRLLNLRCLEIAEATFLEERTVEQLFSSPALEFLTLEECSWGELEELNICAPKLEGLMILDQERVPNSFQEEDDLPHCRIRMDANNLKSFLCISPFLNDYLLRKSCSMEAAEIYVTDCSTSAYSKIANRLSKLLRGMCSTTRLILSGMAVKVLSWEAEIYTCLPVFNNLKFLSLGLLDLKRGALVQLLHNSPHLETLLFGEGFSFGANDEGNIRVLDPVPRCFESSLKNIKIITSPSRARIDVIQLLHKHALVLEKLTLIVRVNPRKENEEKMFIEQILKLSATSEKYDIVKEPQSK